MIQYLKGCSIIKELSSILSNKQKDILNNLTRYAQVYLVGGALRNYYLGYEINDIDVEVNDIDFILLKQLLNDDITYVNDKFKVITLNNKMQIGLSRYELKKGHHYHDYDLVFDNVNVKKTVIRRDFSINALLYDYNNKKMIDLVNGINDLNHRLLRMVNKHKFSEDSSRVLRLLKFKFTYNLDVEEKTRKQAIKMDSYLWEQPYYLCNKLFKSIIKAPYFDFDDFAYYLQHFLLIDDLIKCISRSQYHPEKTLYNHIKGNILALQLFMDDLSNKEYYLLFWTLFFHDYGKIVNSKKHAQLSVEYFEKYQLYFFDSPKQITLVKELINDHMRIREYALSNKTSAMARLKQKYGHDFKYLEYVGLCDYAGRSIDFSIKEIKMRMTWFEDNVLAKYRVIK